ncbi:MAG: hypothetical protein ABUL41_03490 [Chitinophagaceae bacterium]
MKLFFLLLLLQSVSAFAQDDVELPAISANNKDFFIPLAVYKKYNMEAGQADDVMKVYNNFADSAAIQRVSDIRWQAKDKAEAQKWYKDNIDLLSEKSENISSQLSQPPGVDSWNVYAQSKEMKEMMKSLGVDQNHYYFTFTVDQYVAKIFVATSAKKTLQDAWQLAKEGLIATLKAAGKPKLAGLVL